MAPRSSHRSCRPTLRWTGLEAISSAELNVTSMSADEAFLDPRPRPSQAALAAVRKNRAARVIQAAWRAYKKAKEIARKKAKKAAAKKNAKKK